MQEALPNSPTLGSRSAPGFPESRAQESGAQSGAFSRGVGAPAPSGRDLEDQEVGASPGKGEVREAGGRPTPALGSTPRLPRARCRLRLGHDPRLGSWTIGREAGAAVGRARAASSLRGEPRSTPGVSPLGAQPPLSLPSPTFPFFIENVADSHLLLD